MKFFNRLVKMRPSRKNHEMINLFVDLSNRKVMSFSGCCSWVANDEPVKTHRDILAREKDVI